MEMPKMSNLSHDLGKKKDMIDNALNDYVQVVFPEELYRAARHLIEAGGKRLRPSVLLIAAQTVDTDIAIDKIIPAAVAVELIHNFTLIHDDIMDADETRRSIETVHTKWGTSEGILAGDALYAKAFEVLSYTRKEPDKVTKCLRLLAKACLHVCEGQWLDIAFEHNRNVSEADYLDMVQKKTAVLYAASLAMGGILGGGTEDEVRALWEFGIAMGISFQIRDDVLDLVTPYEVLGKDRASDLIEGKMTLIIIHGLQHGITLDPSTLTTENEIDKAIEALQNAGSIDYAMDKAKELLTVGKLRLSIIADSEAKDNLIALADYMISRVY